MRIGEIAAAADVNIQTLRYYERVGLLPEPERRSSGYRAYAPETVRRVRFIKRAQDLGFTLREIADLLKLREQSASACEQVEERASATLDRIREKIRYLESMEAALFEYVTACRRPQPLGECPLLHTLDRPVDGGAENHHIPETSAAPRIDLVFDPQCPNVAEARALLRAALEAVGLAPQWREWERAAKGTPPHLRGLGSPSILVDGIDVSDIDDTQRGLETGNGCRVYRHADRLRGVPTLASVTWALARGSVST